MTTDQALFDKLCRELFQTETSATRHSRREAARLGDSPPAKALLAVADHADQAMAQLPLHLRRARWSLGTLAGHGLAVMRASLIDLLVDRERSYRGTLLGMHHGVDLVKTLTALAWKVGDVRLAEWCAQWLKQRPVLVESAAEQLKWFAQHSDKALENGRTPLRA